MLGGVCRCLSPAPSPLGFRPFPLPSARFARCPQGGSALRYYITTTFFSTQWGFSTPSREASPAVFFMSFFSAASCWVVFSGSAIPLDHPPCPQCSAPAPLLSLSCRCLVICWCIVAVASVRVVFSGSAIPLDHPPCPQCSAPAPSASAASGRGVFSGSAIPLDHPPCPHGSAIRNHSCRFLVAVLSLVGALSLPLRCQPCVKKKKKKVNLKKSSYICTDKLLLAMHITDNFTLEELLSSATARRNGIDNSDLPYSVVIALTRLTLCVLQPIRDHFKEPVIISSGYRCPALNKLVGGVANSQHILGQAADIYLDGDTEREALYFKWVRNNLDFDQLILEGNQNTSWIHVSYVSPKLNRKQSWMQLTKTSGV